MKDLKDCLARLESLSAALNESSDSLNQAIDKIEAKLATLRLGVAAWLTDSPLAEETATDQQGRELGHYVTLLGYAKEKGTWRLLVSTIDEYCPEDTPNTPLKQAPREIRVKALEKLPELLAYIEKKAREEIKEIEKAKSIAESL